MTSVPAALDLAPTLVVLPGPRAAVADATGAQIGTPAFFIAGKFVAGALPFEEFQRRIDAALAAPH